MRIAVLTDIHGNTIALDAVLADIVAQGGVDAYWFLGDLVAIGPDPVGVIERLISLPNARFVRGNTDHYVTTGTIPDSAEQMVLADINTLAQFRQVVASFAWTAGAVVASGYLDWLSSFPVEQREVLPDGTRMLGVHASPGHDDGRGIRPDLSDAELLSIVQAAGADLICVGHLHFAEDRQVAGIRVLNVAGVSNPTTPDLRAGYALIDTNNSGYTITARRVDYDHEAVIALLARVRHPATAFITRYLRGQHVQFRVDPQ